jgi:hypothetical protein
MTNAFFAFRPYAYTVSYADHPRSHPGPLKSLHLSPRSGNKEHVLMHSRWTNPPPYSASPPKFPPSTLISIEDDDNETSLRHFSGSLNPILNANSDSTPQSSNDKYDNKLDNAMSFSDDYDGMSYLLEIGHGNAGSPRTLDSVTGEKIVRRSSEGALSSLFYTPLSLTMFSL